MTKSCQCNMFHYTEVKIQYIAILQARQYYPDIFWSWYEKQYYIHKSKSKQSSLFIQSEQRICRQSTTHVSSVVSLFTCKLLIKINNHFWESIQHCKYHNTSISLYFLTPLLSWQALKRLKKRKQHWVSNTAGYNTIINVIFITQCCWILSQPACDSFGWINAVNH